MDSTHQITLDAAIRAIQNETVILSSETKSSFVNWLVETRLKTRLYFLGTEIARVSLWPQLREDEPLLNLVLNTSIHFQHQLDEEHLDALAVTLGKAISQQTTTHLDRRNNTSGITDDEFHSMTPDVDACIQLLKRERWVCFLAFVILNLGLILPEITTYPKTGSKHAENTHGS